MVAQDPLCWVAVLAGAAAGTTLLSETAGLFRWCRDYPKAAAFWLAVIVWWTRAVRCGGVLGVCSVWVYDRVLWPLSLCGQHVDAAGWRPSSIPEIWQR